MLPCCILYMVLEHMSYVLHQSVFHISEDFCWRRISWMKKMRIIGFPEIWWTAQKQDTKICKHLSVSFMIERLFCCLFLRDDRCDCSERMLSPLWGCLADVITMHNILPVTIVLKIARLSKNIILFYLPWVLWCSIGLKIKLFIGCKW